MHDWRSKKLRKERKKSQTPGKQKVESCQAGPLKKYLAKKSRSYKHPSYRDWNKIFKVAQ